MPRLHNTVHLGFPWLIERKYLLKWQNFMRLFFMHLRDLEETDEFYFDLVEFCAHRFDKQSPKRLIVDAYLQILNHEGRLHDPNFCYFCNDEIWGEISLTRGFLPSHEACTQGMKFSLNEICDMYKIKKCLNLDDEDVEKLYEIVMQGF